ncbi:uncharacterized protein LOC126672611 [Mercurialis annua]|uniref:uncharacterized protein LOC126672611 n=1 Tax=Mercurialis annua TaxID=3986 RepID=UPI002160DCE6|nr:uncharacterized protein LOC126672611 [Mercurialis annua]
MGVGPSEEILICLNFPENFINLTMNCIKSASFFVNCNGVAGSLFKSSKGLRQGDPVSPLLFVVCMEYLSRILKNADPDFTFHKGCKKLKINHLMFADDLLLFCHGDIKSILFLANSLNSFKNSSGLSVNPTKSQIFFCNIDSSLKVRICEILGFKEGVLPLRYLGIPLISTRLSKTDCQGIIDKITARICSWTSRFLSYAGRVQLIQAVLMSMHVFWASIMVLPKKINKEIQSICARFLWTGKSEGRYSAMVSWQDITKQKKNVGLAASGVLKQTTTQAGFGEGCSLLEKFPRVKMKDANIPKHSSLADIWRNNRWILPDPIDNDTEEAWNNIKNNVRLHSNVEDAMEWKVVCNNKFSIAQTWNEFREHHGYVSWHKLIWGKDSIPRFNFILWLVMKRKLKTKDRLYNWGVVADNNCIFCSSDTETIDQCFYDCHFVKKVWDILLPICCCPSNIRTWRRLISWFVDRATGKNVAARLRRIILTATVYFIWKARNRFIFANETPSVAGIIKNVRSIVIEKIKSPLPSPSSTSVGPYPGKPVFTSMTNIVYPQVFISASALPFSKVSHPKPLSLYFLVQDSQSHCPYSSRNGVYIIEALQTPPSPTKSSSKKRSGQVLEQKEHAALFIGMRPLITKKLFEAI